MRVFLLFTLCTICSVHLSQAGIYRRYVRRTRPRPPSIMEAYPMPMMVPHDRFSRREFHFYVPNSWPSLLRRAARSSWSLPFFDFNQPPRMPVRPLNFNNAHERRDNPHFHRPPGAIPYQGITPRRPMGPPSFNVWRPREYGSPIVRDPTFDYAPPSLDRVRIHSEPQNRRAHDARPSNLASFIHRPPPPHPNQLSTRPPFWKAVGIKPRPQKRPFFSLPRPFQRIPLLNAASHPHPTFSAPNQLNGQSVPNGAPGQFRPTDMPHYPPRRPPGILSAFGFPPRIHYPPPPPGRPSEQVETWRPAPNSGEAVVASNESKPSGGNKEYIFTVVGFKDPKKSNVQWNPKAGPPTPPIIPFPTSTKKPTILHAVKTTPSTITSTRNSVSKPLEPTESLEPSEPYYKNHKHPEEVKYTGKSKIFHSEEYHSDEDVKVETDKVGPVFPNSFTILESVKDYMNREDSTSVETNIDNDEVEGTVVEIPNVPKRQPVFASSTAKPSESVFESFKTSTSVSVSMSKTDIISAKPVVPSTTGKATATTTEAVTSTAASSTTTAATEGTTPKPTKYPKLPTMPSYKKKQAPVYARKHKSIAPASIISKGKYSSSSSSSALAKEMNGSGEIVVITAGRSKVKEYKPQALGDNAQLIAFDKVAESSSTSVSTSVNNAKTTPSPSSTTTKSPLQEFDPMQLLHSWFTKSD